MRKRLATSITSSSSSVRTQSSSSPRSPLPERRVADLEQQLRDGDERYRALADEKAQLAQELSATKRDLSKADAFKRSILFINPGGGCSCSRRSTGWLLGWHGIHAGATEYARQCPAAVCLAGTACVSGACTTRRAQQRA